MTKRKKGIFSSLGDYFITPLGDFENQSEKDQIEFHRLQEEKFYNDPLIPWWFKVAHKISPVPLHKRDRVPTWCKFCGRKHDRRMDCEMLKLEEDLTVPPTKENKDGDLIPNRKIGYYTTR